MEKASVSFKKKMKVVSRITAIPATAALLIITILLTGTTITTSAVWATTGTMSSGNSTDTDVSTQGNEDLAGGEAVQQTTTVEEEQQPLSSSANQSEATTTKENASFTEGPMLEEPIVPPLNQTGPVEPGDNITATAVTNATNATATNATNPDGEKIAFSSNRDGNYEIYVMNAADGSGVTRLTNSSADDFNPNWSPDGEKIVFASLGDDIRTWEIYIMNADGSGQTRLTDNDAFDREPTWSPDGEKIAFSSNRDGNYEIYVMNAADGSGVTRLTDEPAQDRQPSWSPDSTKIAFVSGRDRPPLQGEEEEVTDKNAIHVMNSADGSGVTRLTAPDRFYSHPTYSPDGEKIAFESGGIHVMNAADGSGATRLTDGRTPTYSPDGEKIAFESGGIHVMNAADGSGATRLTDGSGGDDRDPSWSPDDTTTSPPGGGQPPPAPAEQAINEAISAIQNLDSITQSLKTNLIALLRQVLDSLNNVTTNGTGGVTRPSLNNNTVGVGAGGNTTTEPLTVEVFADSSDESYPDGTMWLEANVEGGTEPYTFLWDFGDGQQSDTQNTHHTYENPGTYTATVTVTDATGQTASDSVQVNVGDSETTEEGEGNTTRLDTPTTTEREEAVAEEPPAGTTTMGTLVQ